MMCQQSCQPTHEGGMKACPSSLQQSAHALPSTQNATGFPPMLGLLMQLQRINVSVLQLDANTSTAFGQIYDVELILRDMGFLNPNPAKLLTLLTTANGTLAEPASTAALVAALGVAAAALDGLDLSTMASNLNTIK